MSQLIDFKVISGTIKVDLHKKYWGFCISCSSSSALLLMCRRWSSVCNPELLSLMINTSLIFICSEGIIYSTGNALLWRLLTGLKQSQACFWKRTSCSQPACSCRHVSEFHPALISDSSQIEIVSCHRCVHCLFNCSLSQSACMRMWVCAHTSGSFCFLTYRCVYSSFCAHTKHTWPFITVCLPLRQQMLQPCHNSLEVWCQTLSLGPLGSNLLTLQPAPP